MNKNKIFTLAHENARKMINGGFDEYIVFRFQTVELKGNSYKDYLSACLKAIHKYLNKEKAIEKWQVKIAYQEEKARNFLKSLGAKWNADRRFWEVKASYDVLDTQMSWGMSVADRIINL
jgi:hypothetical protein